MASPAASAAANVVHRFLCIALIALSVYRSGAGEGTALRGNRSSRTPAWIARRRLLL